MNIKLPSSWENELHQAVQEPYFTGLVHFVEEEYSSGLCYPKVQDLFSAFEYCPFDAVKVVIIGQDPYHGAGQANGLCFSVHDPMPHPPSLRNIFKEIQNDTGKPYPSSGDLKPWALQGVLLLNATLTVKAHEAGSHQNKGWEQFTDLVIKKLSDKKKNLVFLLWGGFAKKKARLIDSKKHHVLTSGHPSPLSANRGYWFGNKHFSKTNAILKQESNSTINW